VRLLASILLLLSLGCAGLPGAERGQDRGKKVIDEAITALGGERFLKVRTRVETGRAYSFYRERLSGLSIARIYTRYSDRAAPGSLAVRERQTFGKKEDIVTLFLEDQGYQLSYRGARPLPAPLWARYKDSTLHNVFYIFRERLKEPGLIFDAQGTEIIDNQPVEKVDIVDAEGRTASVYFHRSTKLPVRQVFFRRDPETKERIEEVTIYSKYRDVGDGVQWPFSTVRERNGERIFELYSDSVTIDKELPDSLFNLPPGVKMLKQEK
jgi:hypothetical protein